MSFSIINTRSLISAKKKKEKRKKEKEILEFSLQLISMHHTVYDHHSNKTSIHIHQRWYLSTGLQHNVSNESCAIIVKHFLKVAVADNNGSMDVEGFDEKKTISCKKLGAVT